MPPILWVFWSLIGLGVGGALWGPPHAWDGIDPTTHSEFGQPARGFNSWLSVSYEQTARRNVYGQTKCEAVAFGVSLGQRTVRAQFDGVEQNIGWSWSVPVEANLKERRNVTVRYLDPEGGTELACHTLTFLCVPEMGWDGWIDSTVSIGEPCREDAGPQKGVDQTGDARLVFVRPGRVMATQYVPGVTYMIGTVTLVAEIRGEITEEWYCPRVEWEFPLDPGFRPNNVTKSVHEEDCAPFTPELAAKQSRRYVKRVVFPEGTWTVTVSLWHGDRLISRQSTQVTVGNATESGVL